MYAEAGVRPGFKMGSGRPAFLVLPLRSEATLALLASLSMLPLRAPRRVARFLGGRGAVASRSILWLRVVLCSTGVCESCSLDIGGEDGCRRDAPDRADDRAILKRKVAYVSCRVAVEE
jgi:hypothetical protein